MYPHLLTVHQKPTKEISETTMAPIKIKVDESLLDEMPILCRIPRHKRDISFLIDGEQLKGSDDTCDYRASAPVNPSTRLFCVATLDTTESEDGYQTLTVRPAGKFYETWETSVRGYEQHLQAVEGARAQYKAMIQDFASAKKQRVVRSREANRLAVGNDKIETTVDPNKISAAEIATNEWRKSFLPKWNAECPEPAKVFEFQDTIGPGLWNWVENLAVQGFSLNNSPPSMEKLFEERLCDKVKPTKLQLTCGVLCVFFTNLYIRLHRTKLIRHVDASKPSYFGTPVTIAERFLSRFATTSGYGFIMTKSNSDSCLVHILLLYLMASHKHAKVDSLRGISTDLMIDGTEAARLLRQAGCKVLRKNNTHSAWIHVPLTFPASSLGRR
jgi:A49-like RNA polymerase I associated factor